MNFKITAAESRALISRLLIVSLISFGMGLVLVYLKLLPVSNSSRFVYTFSIGISIWLFVEISELCFFYEQMRQLKSTWQRMLGRVVSLVLGFTIGLRIGLSIADEYSGYSVFIILVEDVDQLIGLTLLTAIVATITTSYFAYWRQAATTRSLLSESHLKLLFSQLEPHMLFNTMGTLRALIEIDATRAMEMMDALNNYLRATLKASRSNWHTLAEELDRIQDYLALMSIRMGSRLCYSIDSPSDLSSYLIPPLLLQPLVENAIKHGLEPRIRGGKIHI
jgi:sensor histidine kinase YesM